MSLVNDTTEGYRLKIYQIMTWNKDYVDLTYPFLNDGYPVEFDPKNYTQFKGYYFNIRSKAFANVAKIMNSLNYGNNCFNHPDTCR